MKELLGLKKQFPGALLVAGGTNAGWFVWLLFTFSSNFIFLSNYFSALISLRNYEMLACTFLFSS